MNNLRWLKLVERAAEAAGYGLNDSLDTVRKTNNFSVAKNQFKKNASDKVVLQLLAAAFKEAF